MGLFSWLFGVKRETEALPEKKPAKKRGTYGFDERRADNLKYLQRETNRPHLDIKKIKIMVDKDCPDTCSAIKRMKKIHPVESLPLIPLDREKCQHCTCYYEAVLPRA